MGVVVEADADDLFGIRNRHVEADRGNFSRTPGPILLGIGDRTGELSEAVLSE